MAWEPIKQVKARARARAVGAKEPLKQRQGHITKKKTSSATPLPEAVQILIFAPLHEQRGKDEAERDDELHEGLPEVGGLFVGGAR